MGYRHPETNCKPKVMIPREFHMEGGVFMDDE